MQHYFAILEDCFGISFPIHWHNLSWKSLCYEYYDYFVQYYGIIRSGIVVIILCLLHQILFTFPMLRILYYHVILQVFDWQVGVLNFILFFLELLVFHLILRIILPNILQFIIQFWFKRNVSEIRTKRDMVFEANEMVLELKQNSETDYTIQYFYTTKQETENDLFWKSIWEAIYKEATTTERSLYYYTASVTKIEFMKQSICSFIEKWNRENRSKKIVFQLQYLRSKSNSREVVSKWLPVPIYFLEFNFSILEQ